MTYEFLAADLDSGLLLADLPLTNVAYSRLLNGAGDFSAHLKMPALTDTASRTLATRWREDVDDARRCIYILRDGVPLAAYIIWADGYDSDTQVVEIKGAELWSYLRRRFVGDWQADLTEPYLRTGKALALADELVTLANDIGLNTETVATPSAPDVSIDYQPLDVKPVADAVEQMANAADGFDFVTDLVFDSSGDLQRRWVAAQFIGGAEPALRAVHGVNAKSLKVARQGQRRANWVVAVGAGDGSARAFGVATSIAFGPKLASSLSLRDEADSNRLAASAAAGLRALEYFEVVSIDVVADGTHCQIGTFSPGDLARIIVAPGEDPWFADGYDRERRMVGYTVDVPDTGGPEVVTLALDDPAGEF